MGSISAIAKNHRPTYTYVYIYSCVITSKHCRSWTPRFLYHASPWQNHNRLQMTKRFPNLYPFTRRCICSPYLVLFLACLRAHRAVVYRIGVCIYQRHLHRGTIPYAWTYHHILLPIPCPSVVYTSWPYPSCRLTVPMYHTYVPNVESPHCLTTKQFPMVLHIYRFTNLAFKLFSLTC
jgi:hypothetical protein